MPRLLCLILLVVLTVPAHAQEPPQYLLQWSVGGSQPLDRLFGIAADGSQVFVADTFNDRVVVYQPDGTFVLEWGNGGSGTGQFISPRGIAVDPDSGHVYVTDLGNHRVQVFTPGGTFLRAWGTFGTGDGQFRNPSGIHVDTFGNVYVTESSNNRVQRFDRDGVFITRWGANGGDGTPGSDPGEFNEPFGVGVDASGNVYIADKLNHRVQKFDASGTFLLEWGIEGTQDGEFVQVSEVAVGDDALVYTADRGNHRVQVFAQDGTYVKQWGCFGPAANNFNFPTDIALDGDCAYVADTFNDRVQKFGPPVVTPVPQGRDVVIQSFFSTLTFDSVSVAGTISPRLGCCPVPPPQGLQSVPKTGGLFLWFETTFEFVGNVEICVPYTPEFVEGSEDNLFLIEYVGGAGIGWENIRSSLDTETDIVCGETDYLDIFALVETTNNQIGVDPMAPPVAGRLGTAAPNPFSASTRMEFSLEEPGPVRFQVFDVSGALVCTLMDLPSVPAGRHETRWDGRAANGQRAAPGVYFYALRTPRGTESRRVVFLP